MDEHGIIRYVGRVTESGLNARLKHHKAIRGLDPHTVVKGLSYDEARGLEEIGMIQCHTISAFYPNNKIHGISPLNPNGERYMKAAWDYLFNRAENKLLDLLSE